MTEHTSGYAVFLYEQAWEALGDAIRAYTQDGPTGPHIPCHEVDTAGAFVEMTLRAKDEQGGDAEVELMIPAGMVRMIVSMHSDVAFGFLAGDRALREDALPAVGPAAPAPREPSSAMPHTAGAAGGLASNDDRRLPPEG